MALEVELKAPCGMNIEKKLVALGAKFVREETQDDVYLNHMLRDFKKTDEALRIRGVNDQFFLTYKGPKLSNKTKTREEFEVPVGEEIKEILTRLGFREGFFVSKTRRYYKLGDLSVCVDDVSNLGLYVEVESKNVDDEGKVLDLMRKLGVPERAFTTKTYVELLEEKFRRT